MKPYYQDESCTIYHGDCRELGHLATAETALISDPPYGVAVSLGVSAKGSCGGMWKNVTIKGDESTAARDEAMQTFSALPFAVFGSHKMPPPTGTQATLVWEKGEHVGAGNLALPWKPNFELIFVGGSEWAGQRKGSVIRILAIAGCVGAANTGYRHHPTEKPVGIMSYLISYSTRPEIIDPFMGSGTTLRAAKDLGRKSIGIEIEERYCEIAAKRLAQEVLPLGC